MLSRQAAYLRLDGRSGLLSRLALEDDLLSRGEASDPQSTVLLAIVHLRLLERQGSFPRDGDLQVLLEAIQRAAFEEGSIGLPIPFYRVSDWRIGMLLRPWPDSDDASVLHALEQRIRDAIEHHSGTVARSNDILMTGQRVRLGGEAAGCVELHGYAEALARAAGSRVRLLDAGDAERVEQESAIRARLQSLGPEDIRLHFKPILLLSTQGSLGWKPCCASCPRCCRANPPTGW